MATAMRDEAFTPLLSDSVSEIIAARARRPERLRVMMVGSTVAHALVFALLAALPQSTTEPPVREVMTITWGGPEGPRTGGFTQIGGRPVQQVAPPEPQKVEPRVAPETPKMTLPAPKTPPRPQVREAPAEAAARTPVSGEQIVEGSTPVDTGARGTGFGLSSAGGAGSDVQLDVSNFCCPEYADLMVSSIRRNWVQEQGRPGNPVIRFTVQRNGSIVDITVARSSGTYALDRAAERAVQLTRLPPLPAAFENQTLTVQMTFRY